MIDVQPELLELDPGRKSEVVTTKAPEKTRQRTVGAFVRQMAKFMLKRRDKNTDSNSTTEPHAHTRSTSTTTITDKLMRALRITILHSGKSERSRLQMAGIIKKVGNVPSYSLLKMSHRLSYDCLTFVDSDGREQALHKNSFGFWGKYKFQRYR